MMKLPTTWIALVASSAVFAIASCAESGAEHSPEDAGTTLDAGSIPDSEPPLDAGCDGGTDECSNGAITCAEADFCPVTTGPDPRYALMAVWGSGKNDVWAVGSRGTILHWDGTAWVPTPSGSKQTFFAVAGKGPNDVWAVSSRDVVRRSSGFAGGTAAWTPAPAVAPTYAPYPPQVWNESLLLSLWTSSGGDVWVAGEPYPVLLDGNTRPTNMNLWRRTVAGEWDHGVVADGIVIRGLWGSAPGDVWAVGGVAGTSTKRSGKTFHTTGIAKDGAPVWTEFDSQSRADLTAVWGSGPNDVWAVGESGAVRHWTNATPKRWEIVEVPTERDLRAVWGTGPNDIWVVGDFGTILHFDGVSWQPAVAAFPLGLKPHLRGIWGSDANDVWVVGDSIALHFTGKAANSP
jgi:hypothetical protein